ncbi:Hypothetical predicted protein [Podarcis lilfordi]|uniref:Uncharacterized protein n=1 Tax=Podarcis lilfordi TaxID=74358 RepID=A0AA35KA25_9SAUR|nr:Hypothetical predicted protein [Podarcis lilfordi]
MPRTSMYSTFTTSETFRWADRYEIYSILINSVLQEVRSKSMVRHYSRKRDSNGTQSSNSKQNHQAIWNKNQSFQDCQPDRQHSGGVTGLNKWCLDRNVATHLHRDSSVSHLDVHCSTIASTDDLHVRMDHCRPNSTVKAFQNATDKSCMYSGTTGCERDPFRSPVCILNGT